MPAVQVHQFGQVVGVACAVGGMSRERVSGVDEPARPGRFRGAVVGEPSTGQVRAGLEFVELIGDSGCGTHLLSVAEDPREPGVEELFTVPMWRHGDGDAAGGVGGGTFSMNQ